MSRLLMAAPVLIMLLVPTAGTAVGLLAPAEPAVTRAVVTAEPVSFDELDLGTRAAWDEPAV